MNSKEFNFAKLKYKKYKNELYELVADNFYEDFIEDYFEEHNLRALSIEERKFGCSRLDEAQKYANDCIDELIENCFETNNYEESNINRKIVEYILEQEHYEY
ncbi:hypothetical protein [Campylobacter sp. RM12651]|uniref:hypothetical protein n=1 Tax=Campylobacter sp. RM12651 TaxID=1660079 RepID=UPI001EFA47FB|nr:hypothetical protein [Campylobacter sp. RM12651]ULO03808.1 hypothetical protein AVBRAN_1354 [Campylobacter sp. RM12651]